MPHPEGSPEPVGRGRSIAMALYSALDHDSRVLREAQTLADAGHRVTVYCLWGSQPPDAGFRVVAHIPTSARALPDGSGPLAGRTPTGRIGRVMRTFSWMRDYVATLRAWGAWVVADAGAVDAWHAHDLPGLMAVAPRLGTDAALVYDSHEIFLESGTAARLPSLVRRALGRYERRLVRRAAALVTVNEAYAEVLRHRLAPASIVIVRNCPPRPTAQSASGPSPLRQAAGVPDARPIVLYHGALGAHRGIEQLVAAIRTPAASDAHLVLLGFGDVGRLGVAADEPALEGRLSILPAVPPDALVGWVAGADVDAMPLQRSTMNHWLCTPNKLWESLTAGVPVVVSDFPVMRDIVLGDPSGPLGAVCDPTDPSSIAAAVASITTLDADGRAALRERVRRAADERWNWETESRALLDLYATLPAAPR